MVKSDKKKSVSKKTKKKELSVDLKALEAQIKALESQAETLKSDLAEEKEKQLRSLAEQENFKKRKEQELDRFRKFAVEEFVLELLPVLDSFDRACEHDQTEDKNDIKEMVDGFLMIQKQLHQILEKMNVVAIDALNQPFDPNFHQAISQEKQEGVDANIVVKEFQKGYKFHDKVIRPSMVIVSQ